MSEVLSERYPVALKVHKCTWCGENIPPGEKYYTITYIHDGDFSFDKFHKECHDACDQWVSDMSEFNPEGSTIDVEGMERGQPYSKQEWEEEVANEEG